MRILFAAGDVGGARAILPVAHLAATLSHQVICLAHGVLEAEGSAEWHWFSQVDSDLAIGSSDVIIYATSSADDTAVRIAARARLAGKPALHVLDNWTSYTQRVRDFMPDAYAVMDKLALEEAKAAGVPDQILHVTGHPDLAKIVDETHELPGPVTMSSILFVSEPAGTTGGIELRGYDETIVTEHLMSALSEHMPDTSTLYVAPHPRECRQSVSDRMTRICGGLANAPDWLLVAPGQIRPALHSASRVVGMTSILLYEAWLLGRPTLSLQPGMRQGMARTLSNREGIIFHDQKHGIEESVARWLSYTAKPNRPELNQHESAAQAVLGLALGLISRQPHATSCSALTLPLKPVGESHFH
ncbi:MAG: hypothetical protein AB8B64_25005 [Granulosicoccus sp.]